MEKSSQKDGDKMNQMPEPIRGETGASIMGPRNVPLELENPDQLASPYTDSRTIPNLKFSFATARNRLTTGGWAREVTVRELPVATQLAGVNMRLKPGGIREMHWHKEAEWAYMLGGRARITAVDEQGRNFIDDVGEGDLWNFPSVIPHSIQGLEEGCEFLLVFDNGTFSENETFLITDLFKHTPRDGAGQELRRLRVRLRQHPDGRRARAVYLLREGARPDGRGRGPVGSRHRTPDLQPPHDGPGADHGSGRLGAHHRLHQFPGRDHHRGGVGQS